MLDKSYVIVESKIKNNRFWITFASFLLFKYNKKLF